MMFPISRGPFWSWFEIYSRCDRTLLLFEFVGVLIVLKSRKKLKLLSLEYGAKIYWQVSERCLAYLCW